MKVKIYTLAQDTRANGTMCETFGTEQELQDRQLEIMESDMDEMVNDDQTLKQYLDSRGHDAAWEYWEDNCKDGLDTYSADEHELEVPDVSEMVCVLPPNGEKADTSLQVRHKPEAMSVRLSADPEKGDASLAWDWYGDALQALVFDQDWDDPALHVRYNEDGSIAEIVVRKDLVSTLRSDTDSSLSTWQAGRDKKI